MVIATTATARLCCQLQAPGISRWRLAGTEGRYTKGRCCHRCLYLLPQPCPASFASVSCVTAAQQWPGQCGTAYKTVREILFLSQILVISTEGHIHRKATPRAFHQHSGLQRGDRQQREAREDAIEFFWTYKHLQTRPAIENDRWTTEDETVPHCPALVRILWLLSSG